MSMRQESAISPVGTVEYMAPEVGAGCGTHTHPPTHHAPRQPWQPCLHATAILT